MKRYLPALIPCLIVTGSVVAYIHAQTAAVLPAGSTGRYQIIEADIDLTSMNGLMKHKTVVRIDTQTGQTWELVELGDDKTGRNFYWEPLHEAR